MLKHCKKWMAKTTTEYNLCFCFALFVPEFFCIPSPGPDFAGAGEGIYATANGDPIMKHISNGKNVSGFYMNR